MIDFDDCGFSWFIYDFAAAVSFLETEPYIPALQEAWVRGYRSVAELSDEHVAMIPTFIHLVSFHQSVWYFNRRTNPLQASCTKAASFGPLIPVLSVTVMK